MSLNFLTEDAVLVCNHETGIVGNYPTQSYETIARRKVLIAPDPEGRLIKGCTNANPVVGIRPCLTTLKVKAGYSAFIRIEGHFVCLETVTGLTDGTPPGTVSYKVRKPGQSLVKGT